MSFRFTPRSAWIAGTLAITICLGLPGVSRAADDDDAKPKFELTLYGGLPGMYGDVDIDDGKSDQPVDTTALHEKKNWAAMARARMQAGDFSLTGSGEYMDLRTEREPRYIRPGPHGNSVIRANTKTNAKVWFADLTAGYRIIDMDDVKLEPSAEMYAGARYTWFSPEINGKVSGGSVVIDETESWFDPIIGARIMLELSKTVQMVVEGDVGGFQVGNGSEFAWMQMTSLAWAFTDYSRLHLAYKFQQFRRDESSKNFNEQFRGPYAGLSVAF